MAENTLLPVPFDRPFIKSNVPVENRFALHCFAAEHSKTEAETVRYVLAVGLKALGWTEDRIIQAYAEYRIECLHGGKLNQFEGR